MALQYFQIPFGVKLVNPLPVDARRYNNSNLPYANTAEVIAQHVSTIRHKGGTYYVVAGSGVVEYWFKNGILDGDLILKLPGASEGTLVVLVVLTHLEIETLKDASNLDPGTFYQMSDFKSVYTQVVTGVVSDSAQGITDELDTTIEPIVIQAATNNSFHSVGFSTLFPQDLIYYDFDLDQSAGGSANSKGTIYRRIDTFRTIDVGFDWRQVKYRRTETTPAAWVDVTIYSKGDTVEFNNAVYISLEDSNVNNDPATFINSKWIRFYNLVGAPLFREYFASGESAEVFGLPVTGNFKNFYLFANLVETTTSDGLAFDINNFTLITRKGQLTVNIVLMLDPTFGSIVVSDNYFDIISGSLTLRPDFLMNGVSAHSVFAVKDLYLNGFLTFIEIAGTTFDNTFINGAINTSIVSAVNSIVIQSGGIGCGVQMVESTALDINASTLSLIGNLGKNVNPLIVNLSDITNGTLAGDGPMSFSTVLIDNASVNLVGESTWAGATISADIIACILPRMTSVQILGTLDQVTATARWNGVLIPVNGSFTDVVVDIPAWLGFNVWTGTPLALSQTKIIKRYFDGSVTENLWYEEVNVNGNVTLKKLE